MKTGPCFLRRSAKKANESCTKARVSPIQGSPRLPGGNGLPALLAAWAVSIGSSGVNKVSGSQRWQRRAHSLRQGYVTGIGRGSPSLDPGGPEHVAF